MSEKNHAAESMTVPDGVPEEDKTLDCGNPTLSACDERTDRTSTTLGKAAELKTSEGDVMDEGHARIEEIDTLNPTVSSRDTESEPDGAVSSDDMGLSALADSAEACHRQSPLSWEDARAHICLVLEQYMETPPPETNHVEEPTQSDADRSSWRRMQRWWFRHDMDSYAGALLLSVGLVVLSCFSYVHRKTGYESSALNARAELKVYKSQVAASVLLVFGSSLSIFFVRRRRRTCTGDGDVRKRRTIATFLDALGTFKGSDSDERAKSDCDTTQTGRCEKLPKIRLSAAPRTDMCPAYRRSSLSHPSDAVGEWHLIPSLLLVKGDYIALQVGDTAPAECELVTDAEEDGKQKKEHSVQGQRSCRHMKAKSSNDPDACSKCGHRAPVTIRGGERVTMQSFGDSESGLASGDNTVCFSSFPAGRSTLPRESRKLLTLCNDMRLFVLKETPVESFLHQPIAQQRPPKIYRQAHAIRIALQAFAFCAFMLTVIIIFVRPQITSTDLSLVLPLPFLAALGVLPVMTPLCAFFLEVLGTARILVAVHPFTLQGSTMSDEGDSEGIEGNRRLGNKLFFRYSAATVAARLSVEESECNLFGFSGCRINGSRELSSSTRRGATDLHQIPPASAFLLEKLGVVTALALVDDELACEPHSTPQQLLIPSGHGLKLLDMCPTFDDDIEVESVDVDRSLSRGNRAKSFGSSHDSDSESDEEEYQHTSVPRRTLQALRRRYRRKISGSSSKRGSLPRLNRSGARVDDNEVQFEDPLWWQCLPSLKCIGLACLLVNGPEDETDNDNRRESDASLANSFVISPYSQIQSSDSREENSVDTGAPSTSVLRRKSGTHAAKWNGDERTCLDSEIYNAEGALVRHICQERARSQLLSLAQCIGFSTNPNSFGKRGDITPFMERRRLHVIATRLLSHRLAIDTHALGLEESRSWGWLRPDSTSVIIQDRRSKAYQLLTVGDAGVVTELCQDAWQGENSTISPLSTVDRKAILDTSQSWSLADLDVTAFSYAPVPHTLEQRIGGASQSTTERFNVATTAYLVDNSPGFEPQISSQKDYGSDDWSLIKNQIFLGVLGSSVSPRKEIEKIIDVCAAAGVRFVYFSPRNMRRTKELASQMGIDVAWNCAISLRPLDEGQEDPHRMTSTYADWDINARLPHGIQDVKRHLEEVDNVPLLVSLYTDVTKSTTTEMVTIFQKYSDTVLSIGLSHLPCNEGTFSAAELSVGVDVLSEEISAKGVSAERKHITESLLPDEVEFVSSLAAHSCVFNLKGSSTLSNIPEVIARGRAALEAVISASLFVITGSVTFSFYVLLCPCTASTSIPFVPNLAAVLYIQVILPLIGLTMAMTDSDEESMNRVPPKNDESVTFSRREGHRLYLHAIVKALPPAVFPQILYLIAFGAFLIEFEPELLEEECFSNKSEIGNASWVSVIRCDALREYSGVARTSAGNLAFGEMVLCVTIASGSFVYRTISLQTELPWRRNRAWTWGVGLSLVLVAIFLVGGLERGSFAALPWYFFLLAAAMPFACLLCCEVVKRTDRRHENRAVMLRRLQFETRLGMWSPK